MTHDQPPSEPQADEAHHVPGSVVLGLCLLTLAVTAVQRP